ncbi:DUF2793 domain-containing protein [Phyllobacterium salinisoli]|uniref:DUF2793 domain-containing protein n=1 Tax=Phyllobacterium salinisoli TaxID=1899321 RepID=UPI0013573184|nr:DUF2793 domain-containing protein [Phyllobacterium salinisoli]
MENTANLKLPYILPSQAQKHVTHNEALQILDALVQLSVIDRDLTEPPAGLVEGDRYIVPSGATGVWAGKDGAVASLADGAWLFFTPEEGWLAWVADEDVLVAWTGSDWSIAGGDGEGVTIEQLADGTIRKIGINTAADDTNRLALKSDAILLSHDDVTPGTGNIRATLNKAAPINDAGFVFQTNWSTRALFGILGDNNFTVKVSPNGSSFFTGLTIDSASGLVSQNNLPRAVAGLNFNQNLPAGAANVIQLNTAIANPMNMFDAATNRVSVPASGLYLISYTGGITVAAGGDTSMRLAVNGIAAAAGSAITGDVTQMAGNKFFSAAICLPLNAGDYVQLWGGNSAAASTAMVDRFALTVVYMAPLTA